MKIFRYLVLGLCLFGQSQTFASEQRQWTFLVYMHSSIDLQYWALANLNAMAMANPSDDVTILAQLYLGENTAWRYKIEPGCLRLVDTVTMTHDPVLDMVDAVRWANDYVSAQQFGAIIWDHGWGILDPKYNDATTDINLAWMVVPDGNEPVCSSGACAVENKQLLGGIAKRGCLFDGVSKTYMTNADLIETLKIIHDDILHRNIDLFGADCCKMSMLEVCYQIRDYVDFFVGAQNCELSDGWNYTGLFNSFKGQDCDAESASRFVIDSYAQYYAQATKQHTYTQSALNLACVGEVTDALVALVAQLAVSVCDDPAFKTVLWAARDKCTGMCVSPYYIDLYDWTQKLYGCVTDRELCALPSYEVDEFVALIQVLQQSITKMVVAQAAGSAVPFIHGVSIYYPKHCIDDSYLLTVFVKDTNWLPFVEELLRP